MTAKTPEQKARAVERARAWRLANLEHALAWRKAHYAKHRSEVLSERRANKEFYAQKCKEWRELNYARHVAYKKLYYKNNRNDLIFDAQMRGAFRRQMGTKAFSLLYAKEIRMIYDKRPAGYHVDHIIPLRGKGVCGLHVPWNLQYLPALENLKKHAKVIQP